MIRGGVVEVPVADLARSLRFYVETLGLKLVANTPEHATLDLGGGFLVGLAPAPAERPRATLGLCVASVERSAALLENRGLALRTEAHLGAAATAFSDPDGNVLFLVER
jgi:catechol 2,3-dioxygenase-like lactoylglutathione lyase family enzyme